jgi:hypothetical protein
METLNKALMLAEVILRSEVESSTLKTLARDALEGACPRESSVGDYSVVTAWDGAGWATRVLNEGAHGNQYITHAFEPALVDALVMHDLYVDRLTRGEYAE